MRLLFSAYDYPGMLTGPSSWQCRVPLLLRDLGFDISFRLFWWKDPKQGKLAEFMRVHDVPCELIPFRTRSKNVRAFLESLRGDPPDVVVADNVVPALHAVPHLRRNGVRTVGILRSDDQFYTTVIRNFISSGAGRSPDVWVAVSGYLRELAIAGGCDQRRVHHIVSGTPFSKEPVSEANRDGGEFRIIYSGRLEQQQKRIQETVECMVALCQLDHRVSGVIVGDGPLRDWVEQRVADANVPVRVLGAVPPSVLEEELSQSHVQLLLSQYEGTPTAVMEGMALGVIPICYKMRSGIDELLVDGECGFVVTDRRESVLRIVTQLLDDPSALRRLSVACRDRIDGRFDVQTCAAKWQKLLLELGKRDSSGKFRVNRFLRLPPVEAHFGSEDIPEPSALQEMRASAGRLVTGVVRRIWRRL